MGFVYKDLFGIYLIHLFYVKLLFRPAFYGNLPVVLSVPLFSFLVFVVSIITIKIMRKMPVVRYICS